MVVQSELLKVQNRVHSPAPLKESVRHAVVVGLNVVHKPEEECRGWTAMRQNSWIPEYPQKISKTHMVSYAKAATAMRLVVP